MTDDATPRENRLSLRQGHARVSRSHALPRDIEFKDLASLARFVAGVSHREGPFALDDTLSDPHRHRVAWFRPEAFREALGTEAEAFRAGDGWRVAGTGGEYTFWTNGDGYQVNRGEVPANDAYYKDLAWLQRAKNVNPFYYRAAWGEDADVRAVQAADVEGRPAWRGAFRDGAEWLTAEGPAGPIAYMTPEAARTGARACREDILREEDAPAPRP